MCLLSFRGPTTYNIYLQSINVVECREFRDLILALREDMKESDIPHRTKLRESIIRAWKSYFNLVLKVELEVC